MPNNSALATAESLPDLGDHSLDEGRQVFWSGDAAMIGEDSVDAHTLGPWETDDADESGLE